MTDIVKDVGFRIRELREARGLSQEQRAARADLPRAYFCFLRRSRHGGKSCGKFRRAWPWDNL